MTTSTEVNEIAAALAKAQAAMKNAALNKTNPHFKSKFADLASVRDAVTPALAAHGIALVQTLDTTGDGHPVVFTRLLHASGQWVECCCPIPAAPDMQKMGSAITYARRYSLSAICGIAADEDDDANSAVETQQQAAQQPPPGYVEWVKDLEAVADEGAEALKAAWKKSQPYLRKYLQDTEPSKVDALKAKADKAAVAA